MVAHLTKGNFRSFRISTLIIFTVLNIEVIVRNIFK